LNTIHFETFDLILPLAQRNKKFALDFEGKYFLIFPWTDLTGFSAAKASHLTLLKEISNFHSKTASFSWKSNPKKSLKSWVDRGHQLLERKYGPSLEMVSTLKKFSIERLPKIKFEMGNLHLDLHSENICFSPDGRMKILDFDEAQRGELAWDLVRATAIYAEFHPPNTKISIQKERILELMEHSSKWVQGWSAKDVKHLIARVLMGPILSADYQYESQSIDILKSMNEFSLSE